MLQSFPTKAKSAQRSGKKVAEYSFMGGIPQKIETRSKVRGLEADSEQKACFYSELYCHAGTVTRCPAQLLDGSVFSFCEFVVWRTEGHIRMELERSTNGCQCLRWSASDPVFYISQSLSRQCNDRTESLPNFLLPNCEEVLFIFVSVSIIRQTSNGTHKNCIATDARHNSEWAQLVKTGTG